MSDSVSLQLGRPRRRGLCVRSVFPSLLVAVTLSLSACTDKPSRQMGGPPIEGYNHTSAGINRFSVNGNGGPRTGPHQGGGKQNCCVSLPVKWQPGLQVVVEWEKDPTPFDSVNWPQPAFSAEWTKAANADALMNTRHRAVVDVAPYEDLGIVSVHFLPCDQVKVAAGATYRGRPDHPYNYPLTLDEPKTCPTS